MEKHSKIYVAGHKGLVGSAVVRNLKTHGFTNIITRSRSELDLIDQQKVHKFFESERPDYTIVAAAKVGGILYNQEYQADFLYENMMTAANIIHAAAEIATKKLLFLGSSCIYPRLAPQPISEESLLTGLLEPTNEGYAVAKITCLKLCEKYNLQYGKKFISVMPTNLYGPGDNYHSEHSHVIPGLMKRFHNAKIKKQPSVTIWGSGAPMREFLYVDDLAEAIFVLMEKYDDPSVINVGTGIDVTIAELAQTIKEVTEFKGEIVNDTSRPDGTPRKLLDVRKIFSLGWRPSYCLSEGLQRSYSWACSSNVFDQ